jgi:hypothetical protein
MIGAPYSLSWQSPNNSAAANRDGTLGKPRGHRQRCAVPVIKPRYDPAHQRRRQGRDGGVRITKTYFPLEAVKREAEEDWALVPKRRHSIRERRHQCPATAITRMKIIGDLGEAVERRS